LISLIFNGFSCTEHNDADIVNIFLSNSTYFVICLPGVMKSKVGV